MKDEDIVELYRQRDERAIRARSMYGKGETYAPDEDGRSLLRELLSGHPNYRSRYRSDIFPQDPRTFRAVRHIMIVEGAPPRPAA